MVGSSEPNSNPNLIIAHRWLSAKCLIHRIKQNQFSQVPTYNDAKRPRRPRRKLGSSRLSMFTRVGRNPCGFDTSIDSRQSTR